MSNSYISFSRMNYPHANNLRIALYSLILAFIPRGVHADVSWLETARDCEDFSIEVARYYNSVDETDVTDSNKGEIDKILRVACGPKFKECGFTVCSNPPEPLPTISVVAKQEEILTPVPDAAPGIPAADTTPPAAIPSPQSAQTAVPEAERTWSPKVTATPKPKASPKPTKALKPTATPKATATPKPTATPKTTSTPKPTATPKATSTPKTTASPKPTTTPKVVPSKAPTTPAPKPTTVPLEAPKAPENPKPAPDKPKPGIAPVLPTFTAAQTVKPKPGTPWYQTNLSCSDFLKQLRSRFGTGAKYVDFTPAQKKELTSAMEAACSGRLQSCNFEACKFQRRRR